VVGAPLLHLQGDHLESRMAQREVIRARVSTTTGDFLMSPDLLTLVESAKTTQALPAERARLIARTTLADARFIPHDATTMQVGDKIDISSAPMEKPGATAPGAGDARVSFALVPAVRLAEGVQIYGPGSRAAVSLSNTGSVEGVFRRWKTASVLNRATPVIKGGAIEGEITKQLTKFENGKTDITVDHMSRGYYDGNGGYLTPVVYFTATLHP